MSWSIEQHIGELRPWPDSVTVVRGRAEESRRYVPEPQERIVRCKDCRKSEMGGTRCRLWRTFDLFRTPVHAYVEPNGFCSWGEPMEDS